MAGMVRHHYGPRNPLVLAWGALMLGAFAAAGPAARRRKADWQLDDILLEFVHPTMTGDHIHHTMWPCQDGMETAQWYCNLPQLGDQPPEYCEGLKEEFRRREEVSRRSHAKRVKGVSCDMEDRIKRSYRPDIQLTEHEIRTVANAVQAFPQPANFLVWGSGFDSKLWCEVNREGRTVILENNATFAAMVSPSLPKDVDCKILMVDFTTTVGRSLELLGQDERLMMRSLPLEVMSQDWDVILVDGPSGWLESLPGRAQSMYMSSLLAHRDSIVCVDDFRRQVEFSFSTRYLGGAFSRQKILSGTDMACFFT